MKVIVLDAMGIIYSVGDDVKDLLCPFIAEKGGSRDISKIERLYHSASLGKISPSQFWEGVDINSGLEDEYLQRHKLTDGLLEFLDEMREREHDVWCLSNDLSEWSRKLRTRFELDTYFRGFVISSDVGSRKPDQVIYQYLIRKVGVQPSDMVFIDDGIRNLDTARELGFSTILFAPLGHDITDEKYRVVHTFEGILFLLDEA